MKRAARLALVAGLLTGLTACGIPDNTDVLPRGVAPSSGLPIGEDSLPSLPEREDTTDKDEFIKNYLEAAAGPLDQAPERVSSFLDPSAAATFEPQELRVVRLTEEPLVNPGSADVQLRVQQVGVLRPNGILEPSSSDSDKSQYTIAVQELTGLSGLFVTKTPPVMLLSDEALAQFYRPRTIYFWNRDYTGLVPDVRYMPVSVTREQEPTEIINWLTAGPSPWLDGVVARLPNGTKAIGNVPAIEDDKLEINLTGQALPPEEEEALDRLRRQLMWSLRPNLPGDVALELKINHQVQDVADDPSYLTSNPASRLATVPEQFAVYDGRIHRLDKPAGSTGPVPVVTAGVNRNVRAAAISSSGTVSYAAVVAADGRSDVLRVGMIRAGEQAVFRTTALPTPVGYPSWAITRASGEAGSASGVIPAGGRLWGFSADDGSVRPVDWQGGPVGITAAAVAPDAHRIAVIAGGRLYVAAMTTTGNGVQIFPPRLIRTQMQNLTAVDWSGEGAVVVSGDRYDVTRTGRVAIAEVSMDGAQQTYRLADLGTARVSHLAAYPANPVTTSGASVAYGAGNAAYDAFLTGPVLISAADLADPPPPAPAGSRPSAPFFLE